MSSLPPIAVHPSPLNYRIRSRLHRDGDDIGFYAMRSNRVVPLVPECEVVGPATAAAVGTKALHASGEIWELDERLIASESEFQLKAGGYSWRLSTQSFFSWGAESGLYFSSHRSPPTGTLYVMPLIAGPVSEALEARTIRQLEQRAVQLVIVNKAPYFPMTAGFDSLLDADFERVPGSPALDTDKPLEFYVRRGARIDPRILRWRYSGASVPTVGDALPW